MILVVGATGRLGGTIARRLLHAGRDVRVLVRPGSDHRELVALGAVPVLGDLKEPQTLGAACRGVDAVVTTARGPEPETMTGSPRSSGRRCSSTLA